MQRPEQINITQEAFNQVRRIYMNQKLPKWDEIDPSFYGQPVGHWEGAMLVVETTGVKDYKLQEYVCEDNREYVAADGSQHLRIDD
jgi:bacterioferritin (cytochrome b1)